MINYRLDTWLIMVWFPAGPRDFIISRLFRLALGPIEPLIQWAPRALSLGVKWLGLEADHSRASSAAFSNGWSCNSPHAFMTCTDNFTCFLIWLISDLRCLAQEVRSYPVDHQVLNCDSGHEVASPFSKWFIGFGLKLSGWDLTWLPTQH
jgi:hypothetical protein